MPNPITRFAFLVGLLAPVALFAADGALMIHDPYVRLAPPGAQTTGAFMVISNTSNTDRKLIKAESPVAKLVQLHNHINENGVMKMREVQDIEVKANAQTALKPGSYHIMLIEMKAVLKEESVVPITLSFDDGSKSLVDAPVRNMQVAVPDKRSGYEGMTH